jgi:hypothetical protein
MWRLALLICLGLLVGCYHAGYQYTRLTPAPVSWGIIPVYIDQNFTAQEKTQVANAVMQWNYVLNNYIQLQITSFDTKFDDDKEVQIRQEHGFMIEKISWKQACDLKECNDDVLAFAERGGNIIHVISGRAENEKLSGVMMHEMGHLFGARHVPDTLMDAQYDPLTFQCVDQTTERQVARRQGLDPNKLNYCVI